MPRTGCDPSWITFLHNCNVKFFYSVQKYFTLSTMQSIMLGSKVCTKVQKCTFFHLKTKAKPNCTPPFLLLVAHPLCMVMCHPYLGWALVYQILHLNGGKVSAWVRCSTLQNGKNTAPYREPQHKTQPRHTTTNMSHRCPPFSGFGPFSPWQHPPWTQIIAPLLPMGP